MEDQKITNGPKQLTSAVASVDALAQSANYTTSMENASTPTFKTILRSRKQNRMNVKLCIPL